MQSGADDVLISDLELDNILQSLRASGLECVGSKEWVQQMSMLEELNIQAALQARRQMEESVRDALVEGKKLPLVLRELLVIELWREEILPKILEIGDPVSSFQSYMILFNEANLLNILETCLFHGPACQALEDGAIDLADYCLRQLTEMLSSDTNLQDGFRPDAGFDLSDWKPGMPLPETPKESPREELRRHQKSTGFQLAMKCIGILRYLSDNLEELPMSVTARLVRTHDVPVALVKLLEDRPWIRQRKGKCDQVFECNEWQDIEDDNQVQKLEGQTWMALYNLLSKPVSSEKYEINEYRRGVLIKLLDLFKEPLCEQLPFLSHLRKWLLQLQLGSVPKAKSMLLIEPVAAIRDDLVAKNSFQYSSIAKTQAPLFLEYNEGAFDDEIKTLLQSFDRESVQDLAFRKPHTEESTAAKKKLGCVVCGGSVAKQRCSRCHSERYCGRDCQVKHWPDHKKQCQRRLEEREEKARQQETKFKVQEL